MPAQNLFADDHQSPPMSPPSVNQENDEEAKQQKFSNEDDVEEYEKDEFVFVNLADIHKEIQCPICLGILRKTRKVIECLHRFCRDCIDKSMRQGNKECPVCRIHCPSRRSLRDDLNFDNLIAALYPDINKWEEEIQAKIAVNVKKQTQASGNRKSPAKVTTGNSMHKRTGEESSVHNTSLPESEEVEEDVQSNNPKYSSSADELSSDDSRANGFSALKAETEENDDEIDLSVRLLPKDERSACTLERPYNSCRPTVSIEQLCKYVADQASVNPEDVKLFGRKPPNATEAELKLPVESQPLEPHESLAGLRHLYSDNEGHLVFEYQISQQNP